MSGRPGGGAPTRVRVPKATVPRAVLYDGHASGRDPPVAWDSQHVPVSGGLRTGTLASDWEPVKDVKRGDHGHAQDG
jgi:hypothetical protein